MKIAKIHQSDCSLREQYERYRADQFSKLADPIDQRPPNVPRHLWNTFAQHAKCHKRKDGTPILNIGEFYALMGIDLLEGPRGYKRQAEPGIPAEAAELGAVTVGREITSALRAIFDGRTINGPYKAKVSRGLAAPDKMSYCVELWDLRPEWIEEVLSDRTSTFFVFGDVPPSGHQ